MTRDCNIGAHWPPGRELVVLKNEQGGRRIIGAVALLVLGACSNEPQRLTSPSSPAAHFDVQGLGGIIEGTNAVVCVSADSPEGNYTFTTSNVTLASGGSTVAGTNPAVVASGTCFPLLSRLIPADVDPDPSSSVTFSYTSSDVTGATRTGTVCVDDPGIPASSPCGATVTSHVNFLAGSVATFSFTSPGQMIDALRVTLSNLDISKAPGRKLDDRLREALKALDKGNTDRVCKELDRFIKEANERASKKAGGYDATDLLNQATQIQLALGC